MRDQIVPNFGAAVLLTGSNGGVAVDEIGEAWPPPLRVAHSD